jgi:bla regulator protein BlaR1
METYIIKIILCSSLLISLYYLFLEKERSFKFNRFYLIFALAFSYLIPFLSLNFPETPKTQTALIFQDSTSEILIPSNHLDSGFNWSQLLLIIYFSITLSLLVKSVFSIVKILKLKGEFIKIDDQKIKILRESLSPFSFFGTLYLGENYFKNNKIDDRIFLHEKNHIDQKHSLDLLFVEILKIFTWFNPALYLYKKAIITNHEFLADENVLAKNFEIKPYQQLILEEISTYQNRTFTNQFNFNNTKKRFIMMTKPNSRFVQIKKIFALPVFCLMMILFAQKTYAAKKIENIMLKNEVIKPVEISSTIKTVLKSKLPQSEKLEKITQNSAGIVENISSRELPLLNKIPKIDTIKTQAEFPGGINAFRSAVSTNFNTSVMTGKEGNLKATVYFKIDENGKTSDYKVEGTNEIFNKETLRTVNMVNLSQLWKPATIDGKPVNSVYKLPLTMQFAF